MSGKSIISLANKKFINPEKVLELYTYPSAELQSEIQPISLEDVSEFYSSDVLLDLYNSNKLNTQTIPPIIQARIIVGSISFNCST